MRSRVDCVKAGLAVVLCLTIVLAGCSTDWVSQGEEIVAALIPAAGNIVALVAVLEGKTVSGSDMQAIQSAGAQAEADLQIIQSLIAAYQQAEASAKPGILNQIQSAVNSVQANLQGLLNGLHIKDAATQAKIAAVVGLVLSEVQSLAAIVPLVKNQGLEVRGSGLGTSATVTKAPLSGNAFVASFNSTLTAKTGNAELDRATAGFRIHLHGKGERWGSAGLLK
ncbi:MAG TPA: hypothetical protein VMH04_19215 [Candidatus Solibacter sp.]|nr:hypothetical protein [Candidatus Solibacter sp.]